MQPITTTDAPATIGPYSQGIIANGLLFISGQLPIDPATGAFISVDPVDQCHRLRNIEAIAKAAGADLSKVGRRPFF